MSRPTSTPPFRADHIGSLIRPPKLIDAMARSMEGKISPDELRAVQNAAIDEVVRLQEDAGLPCITDGEFRREGYMDFIKGLGLTRDPFGPPGATTVVRKRIERPRPVLVDDFRYLSSRTRRLPKVCLVGPCRIHYNSGRERIDHNVYPTIDLFWNDVIECYRAEFQDLAHAGCRYIQIDETVLAKFADPDIQRRLAERGDSWRDLLPLYIGVLNRVVADPPSGLSFGIHMCRGNSMLTPNQRASGGYELIAEALFNELNIDVFYLEYDTPRAGDFSPLKYLPKGKTAVLGLVSTKTPELETADQLKRRIDEASKYTDIDQLGLSPQCGFSSQFRGYPLTIEQQIAKLRMVVDVAEQTWGAAR